MIPDLFKVDWPGSCVCLKPELIEGLSTVLASSNFEEAVEQGFPNWGTPTPGVHEDVPL